MACALDKLSGLLRSCHLELVDVDHVMSVEPNNVAFSSQSTMNKHGIFIVSNPINNIF